MSIGDGRKSRKKQRKAGIISVLLAIVAVALLCLSAMVVVTVYHKISDDYSSIRGMENSEKDEGKEPESQAVKGWNQTDNGYKYMKEDGSFLSSQWEYIDGHLYYFDENEYMLTGEWKKDGQVFTCSESGELTQISFDSTYQEPDTGEHLDSLVKGERFWCFLSDEDKIGQLKPIYYQKIQDQEAYPLGGSAVPECTSPYSLCIEGDWIYYLPRESLISSKALTNSEKKICNCLFRMKPEDNSKELIATEVDGYIVVDGTIYYSQKGEIQSAVSGTNYPVGEGQFSVTIKDDDCYLLDGMNEPVEGDMDGSKRIGDRIYYVENGKVTDVKAADPVAGDIKYYLKPSGLGENQAIYRRQSDGEEKLLVEETYGINSYCLVDRKIYYCGCTYKEEDGRSYSQIISFDLDTEIKEAVSERFEGSVSNLYHFEGSRELYGEYVPALWESVRSGIVVIDMDGTISKINDGEGRSGKTVSGNDRLKLVMVKSGVVTCLWNDYQREMESNSESLLWSKAIQLSIINRSPIRTFNEKERTEESEKVIEETEESEDRAVEEPPRKEAPTDGLEGIVEKEKPTQAETKSEDVYIVPITPRESTSAPVVISPFN